MPAPPTQDTVILIDICRRDYSFSVVESLFACVLNNTACPACGSVHRFSRHGSYYKYHYSTRIRILRVRCGACRTTHALMPAFSLPGTSIGTEEAEKYLLARAKGTGRTTASVTLGRLGVSDRYPKQLDRMFFKAVAQAKALFAESVDLQREPMEWVQSLVGGKTRPLWSLNRYCLAHGYNCICFCRASIISFSPTSAGSVSSHNRGSPVRPPGRVGS